VEDISSPAATAAFKLITFFPAMVLRKPVSGEQSSLTDRMNAFCSLEWGDIIAAALTEAEQAATTPQKPRTYKGKKGAEHVDSVSARATRLLRVGELSRAYQTLVTSSPPAQPTPEYVEALRAKHPAPTRPIQLPIADLQNHAITTPELSVDSVRKCINGAAKESQPGPCGFRFEHMKDMIKGPDDSLYKP